MTDLKQEFQEETKLSFSDIPINGVHLNYINWLEKRIEALSIANNVGQSEQCSGCDWINVDYKLRQCLKCKKFEYFD